MLEFAHVQENSNQGKEMVKKKIVDKNKANGNTFLTLAKKTIQSRTVIKNKQWKNILNTFKLKSGINSIGL